MRYCPNIYTALIIADTWPQKKPRRVKILPAAEIIHFVLFFRLHRIAQHTGVFQPHHHHGDQHQLQHNARQRGGKCTGNEHLHGKAIAAKAQQHGLSHAHTARPASMAGTSAI